MSTPPPSTGSSSTTPPTPTSTPSPPKTQPKPRGVSKPGVFVAALVLLGAFSVASLAVTNSAYHQVMEWWQGSVPAGIHLGGVVMLLASGLVEFVVALVMFILLIPRMNGFAKTLVLTLLAGAVGCLFLFAFNDMFFHLNWDDALSVAGVKGK